METESDAPHHPAGPGAHVKAKLRLWTGILAALSVAFFLLLYTSTLGLAGIWSDLLVLCAMIIGVLIIMISHEGYEPTEAVDDLTAT